MAAKMHSVLSLTIQSWTLYPLGLLLIAARIVSRRILLGAFTKLEVGDWIMVFVTVTFTGVIVSVNQVSHSRSNYLPPGTADQLTLEQRENAVYGSKFVMILEEFMLANTWLCKACLLLFYHQMTSGLKQNQLVKIVGGYCLFGYILIQILYLGVWCRPIQQYWQVPVDNLQCASYYHHLITSAVFNITSDLMMLYIPLPILIKARLPLRRKIILCGVFSLGILVILSAILNRYYNFTEPYGSLVYLNWYTGEAATSVFVANIPHLWPLLSKIFALGAFSSLRRTAGTSSSNGNPNRMEFYPMRNGNHQGGQVRPYDHHGYIRSESEERIAGAGAGPGAGAVWPLPDSKDGATLELGPMDNQAMGYNAMAAGGNEKSEEQRNGGIMKTVQIRQYTDMV